MQKFERDRFRAVVKIPAIPVELDCIFAASSTLFENLQQLEFLLTEENRCYFVLHEATLFLEESSGKILNPFVPCIRFEFWDGVTFIIC